MDNTIVYESGYDKESDTRIFTGLNMPQEATVSLHRLKTLYLTHGFKLGRVRVLGNSLVFEMDNGRWVYTLSPDLTVKSNLYAADLIEGEPLYGG